MSKARNVLIDRIFEIRWLCPFSDITRCTAKESCLDPNPHQVYDLRKVEDRYESTKSAETEFALDTEA